jgi:hypothetical protein
MAQIPQAAELPRRLPLEPGLASKPPLSPYSKQVHHCLEKLIHSSGKYLDKKDEKFNHDCSLTDKPQYLNQSIHSLEKYVLVSGEPGGNSSSVCSTENLTSVVFPDENGIIQGNLLNNVPRDITQKCPNIKDEIPVNTPYSSQSGSLSQFLEKQHNVNEQCQNALELNNYLCTQNQTLVTRTCNVNGDVSSDTGDIKVHQWFADSVCKDTKASKSQICETERQTDLLVINLAREQCNFDCCDNCDHFGISAKHKADINRVHTGKTRRQEMYLDFLVDEDIGSSSIKNSGSDKNCSVSNSDSHSVNIEKQDVLYSENKTAKKSLLPTQRRGDETVPEQLEITSALGKFEG